MPNRIRLLVVDDDLRFVSTLTKQLSPRDFDVTPASSVQQGLDLCRSQVFELVLLDLELSGSSNDALLDVLKNEPPLTEVVITGHSIEPPAHCTGAGSCMYLRKPAETAELLRVLKDAYRKCVQRKMAISEQRLVELANMSPGEPPLSILRKLRELDRPG